MTIKYNEAMEHVQLTAEARERILKNIESAGRNDAGNDIRYDAENTEKIDTENVKKDAQGNTGAEKSRISSFRNWRRYGMLAACLILAGILAVLWPKLKKPADEEPTDVASYWAEEYDSLEELSEGIGFPVEDLSVLPINNAELYYLNIIGEIAHVMCKNDDQMIVFRKSRGSEDNSGDYNTYTNIKKENVGDTTVTLKSSDDKAALALWEKDGYSYSMAFEPEVPEEDALKDISSIMH